MIGGKLPIVLVQWYDYTKWLLERVDSIPKNQCFIFGQRLADGALEVLELLVEAAYTREKGPLLAEAQPPDRSAALAGAHGQRPPAFHGAAV